MSRYEKIFQYLSDIHEGCFVPFVVIGDPTIELSIKIIETLISNGADAIELGIPFSDPLADGPTIQKANQRALSNKNNLLKYFSIIKMLREKYSRLPIGILTYANIIYNQGIKNFYLQCSDVGLDSVLIADVPIEESDIFYREANKYHICSVFVCPPDADDALLSKIVRYSQGYIYLLSRSGVTGVENNCIVSSKKLITKLKEDYHSIPVLQGFGIANNIQIKKIMSSGVSGVICGSVIVNVIEKYLQNENKMIKTLEILTKKLKQATKLL